MRMHICIDHAGYLIRPIDHGADIIGRHIHILRLFWDVNR